MPVRKQQGDNLGLRGAYSVDGAAAYLSLSRAEIYRLLGRGELMGFKSGKLRRFSRHELDAWIATQESLAADMATGWRRA